MLKRSRVAKDRVFNGVRCLAKGWFVCECWPMLPVLMSFVLIGSVVFPFSVNLGGMYNFFTVNFGPVALVLEYPNFAFGLQLAGIEERVESRGFGLVTLKRRVDRSFFELLSFVGQTYGVVLKLGYENFSIPSTGFETTFFVSSDQTMLAEYSKTWLAVPSIPVGEGSIGPFALNYEGFSLRKLGDPSVSIDIKRGFANLDELKLGFVQLGSIYSLGLYLFSDRSYEQGVVVNLGWDFEKNRIVGVLGGRLFVEFEDIRFFFSTYGTYIPDSSEVKYGLWIRFLSPLSGDLIVQNNTAYFKVSVTFGE